MRQSSNRTHVRSRRGGRALAALLVALGVLAASGCYPGATPTSAVNALDDRDAVAELKARYFRFLDTKDWSRFHGLFLPDAHVDVSADGGPVFDRTDVFVGFLVATIGSTVTVHQGHMQEFRLTSATTARATWALEDLLTFPIGSGVDAHGFGFYEETYEKVDGEWRIASLRLTRLRMDIG